MDLPASESSGVIAAKLRRRSELVAASKRSGPALLPRNFTRFMQELSNAPRVVKLKPFDPMTVPEFPDLLYLAIRSSKKG